MGAYLILFPRGQIRFIIWLILFVRNFTLPSWFVIGAWVVSQVLMAKSQWDGTADKESALVAVFAHVGGCVFGMIVGIGSGSSAKPPSATASSSPPRTPPRNSPESLILRAALQKPARRGLRRQAPARGRACDTGDCPSAAGIDL